MEILAVLVAIAVLLLSIVVRVVVIPLAIVAVFGLFDIAVGYWLALLITLLLSWFAGLFKSNN